MDAADVLVLGTGVPETVLSAALSLAGQRVVHVDEEEYYGSEWASLSLSELMRWAHAHGTTVAFPRAGTRDLPDALRAVDRHYALSLRPTILPAYGPMIEALVRSNVASYATFRLMDRVSVWSAATAAWTRVPSSKSEIFQDKAISLADKRRLMRFLQTTLQAPPEAPLADALAATQLGAPLQDAVKYGVCLAWDDTEPASSAFARTRQNLQGMGRYGDGAFLVGQYGGAGELTQGFARASAVQGGVFVLGHAVSSLAHTDDGWTLALDGLDDVFTAKHLACSREALARFCPSMLPPLEPEAYEHFAMFVTDALLDAVPAQPQAAVPETALLVFPPGSFPGVPHTIFGMVHGEGTFSCPKGQYVYYLVTYSSCADEAARLLAPAVDALLTHQAQPPLISLYTSRAVYAPEQDVAVPHWVDTQAVGHDSAAPRSSLFLEPSPPRQPRPNLAETLDEAVEQAERAFWALFPSDARKAAYDAAAARVQYHDAADYQGRGGVEPADDHGPPTAPIEFFPPRTEPGA